MRLRSKRQRGRFLSSRTRRSGKLDFEARVPISFSVFPSSYKNEAGAEVQSSTQIEETRIEGRVDGGAAAHGSYLREDRERHGRDGKQTTIRTEVETEEDRYYEDGRRRKPRREYREHDIEIEEESRYVSGAITVHSLTSINSLTRRLARVAVQSVHLVPKSTSSSRVTSTARVVNISIVNRALRPISR